MAIRLVAYSRTEAVAFASGCGFTPDGPCWRVANRDQIAACMRDLRRAGT
ncbi:MAG: hypothetical protein VCF25_01645 [Candidatus Poribacteria bacterium]